MHSETIIHSLHASLYKMRCPKCAKLYSLEREQLALMQSRQSITPELKFACISCQSHFGASTPISVSTDFIETYLIETPNRSVAQVPETRPEKRPDASARAAFEKAPLQKAIVSEFRCPKCGVRNSLKSADCRFCGVVFAKFKGHQEDLDLSLAQSGDNRGNRRELADLWEKVLENYEDQMIHDTFVAACFDAGCLPFASQKYSRILSASPQEEIAREMRRRVVGLASYRSEYARERGSWSFRVPAMNHLVTAFGAAAMVMGFMLPSVKSLAGVGFAAIALSLGVRYFLRPTN